MRSRAKQEHMIDFLFPVFLFFIFAVSAVTVLLLATQIYQSVTENSSLNYTSRTCLSYIDEKIHQNDYEGAIYLGEFGGCQALVMEQSHDDETYETYIYTYGNELKELFIKDGVDASPSAGQTIMEVQDFTMEELSGDLLKFTCVDEKNQESSTIISVNSKK